MEVDDMYSENEPEEMEFEENVSVDNICIFIHYCGKTSKIRKKVSSLTTVTCRFILGYLRH